MCSVFSRNVDVFFNNGFKGWIIWEEVGGKLLLSPDMKRNFFDWSGVAKSCRDSIKIYGSKRLDVLENSHQDIGEAINVARDAEVIPSLFYKTCPKGPYCHISVHSRPKIIFSPCKHVSLNLFQSTADHGQCIQLLPCLQ